MAFLNNFCPFKSNLSGNTVIGFKKIAKLPIFDIFNQLLFTQTVNVARFARIVE